MSGSAEYTIEDMQRNRAAAVAVMEGKGWSIVNHPAAYQPMMRKGTQHVELRRILKTPKFEVVRIDPAAANYAERYRDHPTKPCSSDRCRMPVVWAFNTATRKRMPFDSGMVGGGTWQLTQGIDNQDKPCVVATYDDTREFGHVTHFATCVDAGSFRRKKT